VRVIAASNRDLAQSVAEGRLREDLMYRLCVIPLAVPPLRDRDGDSLLLAEMFLAELNATYGTDKVFSDLARARVAAHSWPGNVRELKNAVHRAYVLSDDMVNIDVGSGLPERAFAVAPRGAPQATLGNAAFVAPPLVGSNDIVIRVGTSLDDAERALIMATLDSVAGSKAKAAQVLGISLKTLYNRLHAYRRATASPASSLTGPGAQPVTASAIAA
jgi:DNA-binding NtrC family response regulator